MRTFCKKNRVSFTLGLYQYTYQYQGTVFYSHCEHYTQYCKKKLLYFCNIFIIIYCTVAVVVETVHSYPSSAQTKWSIFDCFTSFLAASLLRVNFPHFMDFTHANCVQAMVLLHV